MKHCDIHNGLDKKDLRDFIGKYIFAMSGEHYIRALEAQISALQKDLKKAHMAQSIQELAEELGWQGFDISDKIEDYDPKTYFNFVGTKDEVQSILKAIENELQKLTR